MSGKPKNYDCLELGGGGNSGVECEASVQTVEEPEDKILDSGIRVLGSHQTKSSIGDELRLQIDTGEGGVAQENRTEMSAFAIGNRL